MTVGHVLEEIEEVLKPRLRGVLHQGAFAVSLVTGTVLICLASGARERVAVSLYAGSVALLFGTSAAYHRRAWSARARSRMERLDHSMIFVLIGGSYTPFVLELLRGWHRWIMLGAIWGGVLLGIITKNLVWHAPRWFSVSLYLSLGWAALAIIPQVLREGGVAVLVLVGAGGLLYTLGAVVYALRKPDPWPRWFGFHEVFHALTIAAFTVQYVAVSLVVYRA